MTDVTSAAIAGRRTGSINGAPSPMAADGEASRADLIACVELLFFAYRDFTRGPDAMLEQYGFGRAHHRVLHFVKRNPGLRVAQLLEILGITKQSLARVLRQLVSKGFIVQRAGAEDRRERLLYVTAKGGRLADKLAAVQMKRIERALATAGPNASEVTRRFLFAMIAEEDRPKVEALIKVLQEPAEASASTGGT